MPYIPVRQWRRKAAADVHFPPCLFAATVSVTCASVFKHQPDALRAQRIFSTCIKAKAACS